MEKLTYLEQVARGLTKLPQDPIRKTKGDVVNLLIIVDRSLSMKAPCGRVNRLEAAKQATISLIEARIQTGASDRLSIIAFNDDAQLVLPFTSCSSHRRRIQQALGLIAVGGGTALKAPLVLANTVLPAAGHRHVVLLSDGHGGDPVKAARKLKDRGVIIETIGVGNDPSDVDESILKKTASVVGGQVLYRFLTDADRIVQYFRTDIANRLAKRG